jgi:carboxypeptidase PM20D1
MAFSKVYVVGSYVNMRSVMKKILLILFVLLILFIIGLFIRTLTYPFTRVKKSAVAPVQPAVNDSIVARFAGGIKIATISIGDSTLFNHAPFEELNSYIRHNFPLIYRSLETYTVNGHALVIRLKGSDRACFRYSFFRIWMCSSRFSRYKKQRFIVISA